MEVLLVKLTSMGDLIHALPALTDAKRARPEIKFSWVIDESFADIASWHPAVINAIPTAHRRWRKNWRAHWRNKEIPNAIKALRAKTYDLVLDGQTNLKAGIITKLCKGPKAGLDWNSARDAVCSLVYKHKYFVDKKQHAVARLRQLFAQALNYELPTTKPDFGIDVNLLKKPTIELPPNYLLFVHSASWNSKLWPEQYWQQLIKIATSKGHTIVLPHGNAEEKARAERLATVAEDKTIVLPKLPLSEIGYITAKANGAICVDTGLSHLASALGVAAVTVYGATDSGLIGAPGDKQVLLQSQFACAPCYKHDCQFKDGSAITPACYQQISPTVVWDKLSELLQQQMKN